jgi:predicted Zn finger-like uncharacterized protein
MNEQSVIIQCRACGAKNRIPHEKSGLKAKCGKCGESIDTEKTTPESSDKNDGTGNVYLVRCLSCRAKNRIPESKMNETAICGKCHQAIETVGLLSGRSIMVSDRDFESKVLQSPVPVMFLLLPTGARHVRPSYLLWRNWPVTGKEGCVWQSSTSIKTR